MNRIIFLLIAMFASMLMAVPVVAKQFPAEGSWVFTAGNGPGSGLSVARNGERMMIILNTYDEMGEPVWLFAGSALQVDEGDGPDVFAAPLRKVSNGSCLDCPFNAGEIVASQRSIEIQFNHPNQGELRLLPESGQQRFTIKKVNVGQRAIPSDDFPDLSGEWIYVINTDSDDETGDDFIMRRNWVRLPDTFEFGRGLIRYGRNAPNPGPLLTCGTDVIDAVEKVTGCILWTGINPAGTANALDINHQQMVFELWSVKGQLVGYRMPEYEG